MPGLLRVASQGSAGTSPGNPCAMRNRLGGAGKVAQRGLAPRLPQGLAACPTAPPRREPVAVRAGSG
jgi:hypothetical protein